MRNALRAVLLAFWPFLICFAQSGAVRFGNADVQLGMQKADVLRQVSEEYDVKDASSVPKDRRIPQADMWSVFRKEQKKMGNPIGFLQFIDDKVVVASKNLGDISGDEASRLIGELFRALQGVSLSGQKAVPIAVQTHEATMMLDGREFRSRTIYMDVQYPGRKRIMVDILEPIGSGSGSSSNVKVSEGVMGLATEETPTPSPKK
jgi:hypothetical protein